MAKKSDKPVFCLRTISDVVIHYIFASQNSEPVLRSFINAVLTDAGMTPVKQVKVENPFNIETYPTEKVTVLDILAEDEQQRNFHIEVQVLEEQAFIKRCLYYTAKVFSTQLVKGDDYTELKPVISIILTDFDLFPNQDQFHTSFMMMARKIPDQILSDDLQIHFLQMPKDFQTENVKNLNSSLLNWLRFFGFPDRTNESELLALGTEDKGLEMAIQAFNNFQNDPKLRDLAERREKFRLDVASSQKTLIRKAKEEGIAEGKAELLVELLLQMIEWNLGEPSDEIRTRIQHCTDMEKLNRVYEMIHKHQIETFADLTKQLD